MAKRVLSELESFVIGLVWQTGPCSPYDLRRSMRMSPSTQWSASAGAIYPLVERLSRRGLLKGRTRRVGLRRRKEYEITAQGLKMLRAWIGPPLPPEAITVSYDPLRSRARFLQLLTPSERREWIVAAKAALAEVERLVLTWDESAAGELGAAAKVMTRSGLRDVTSRREWLGDVAGLLSK